MTSNFKEREEAIKKYKLFREIDPFPDVLPALLNSADVYNYIKTVGIIYPFDVTQLKGVTLGLKIGKLALYWNEDKQKKVIDITKEKEFILKSNTIAYVAIEEELRLPAYIITRFNLRVTNVYKGILLGTGPIVDPGFEGNLFIPLHNLTNNDYVFYPGEPFIEMEFTKISYYNKWRKDPPHGSSLITDGKYLGWTPTDKKEPRDREIDYYLNRANMGRSIESSLPVLKKETKEAIEKATKVSDKVDTSLSRINVGLLFAFGALLTAIVGIVNVFKADIREIKEQKFEEKIRNIELQHKNDSITIQLIMDSLSSKNIIPKK